MLAPHHLSISCFSFCVQYPGPSALTFFTAFKPFQNLILYKSVCRTGEQLNLFCLVLLWHGNLVIQETSLSDSKAFLISFLLKQGCNFCHHHVPPPFQACINKLCSLILFGQLTSQNICERENCIVFLKFIFKLFLINI